MHYLVNSKKYKSAVFTDTAYAELLKMMDKLDRQSHHAISLDTKELSEWSVSGVKILDLEDLMMEDTDIELDSLHSKFWDSRDEY